MNNENTVSDFELAKVHELVSSVNNSVVTSSSNVFNTSALTWHQQNNCSTFFPKTTSTFTEFADEMFIENNFESNSEMLDLNKLKFISIISKDFKSIKQMHNNNYIFENFYIYTIKYKINEKQYINKISSQYEPDSKQTDLLYFFFLPQAILLPEIKKQEFIDLIQKYDNFLKIKKLIFITKIKSVEEDLIEKIIE